MSYGESSASRYRPRDGISGELATDREDCKICHCGRRLPRRTSWTRANPGRRFWSCSFRDKGCNFFEWKDPPHSEWSKQVILHLIDENERRSRLEISSPLLSDRTELETHLDNAIGLLERSTAKFETIFTDYQSIRSAFFVVVGFMFVTLLFLWLIYNKSE